MADRYANAARAPHAEALAAVGESNADNWVVMQKGLPLLIAMLQAPDLRQAEAAVRVRVRVPFTLRVTVLDAASSADEGFIAAKSTCRSRVTTGVCAVGNAVSRVGIHRRLQLHPCVNEPSRSLYAR